ncbi:MAG: hypothetical protein AB7U73_18675, partial [Pirellulales bacterium]
AQARQWVEQWRGAGHALERIARDELQKLDSQRTIELLCCDADFSQPPWTRDCIGTHRDAAVAQESSRT